MLKFRWRSTTKPAAIADSLQTTRGDIVRDHDHPLHIRNLLDYPQLQAVMGGATLITEANVSSIESARFNRRRLLEGAA